MAIMKKTVVFLSKRRPQQRDLFCSPYGRFFNLPKQLALLGYDVHLVLADYMNGEELITSIDQVKMYSIPCQNPFNYFSKSVRVVTQSKADCIVAFSDTYFGIIASKISKKKTIPFVVDAYDNYEAYLPFAKPLHWLWRNVLQRAHGLTAAGPELLELMSGKNQSNNCHVVPMAADTIFQPMDKLKARQMFGLSEEKIIVGYVGSISKNRNIDFLFDALNLINSTHEEIEIVLSGYIQSNIAVPKEYEHLGYIDADKMPYLVNALDVSLVVNQSSEFGDYSYPVKAYESLACHVPALMANTKTAKTVMKSHKNWIYEQEDVKSVVRKISDILWLNKAANFNVSGWDKSALNLDVCIDAAINNYSLMINNTKWQ